jgi:RNA exonuclease 4
MFAGKPLQKPLQKPSQKLKKKVAAKVPKNENLKEQQIRILEKVLEEKPSKFIVPKIKEKDSKVGKFIAMDCEMVGVGSGGLTSVLARVSLVNFNGAVILDEYVLPQEAVVDYRTAVSGITPKLLKENGVPFKEVQQKVADIIKDKIIIGHALKNDFNALMLDHPRRLIRDTARYKPLKNQKTKGAQSLKMLSKLILNKEIQSAEHSSVEDAVSALNIYKMHKHEWEQSVYRRNQIKLEPHSW